MVGGKVEGYSIFIYFEYLHYFARNIFFKASSPNTLCKKKISMADFRNSDLSLPMPVESINKNDLSSQSHVTKRTLGVLFLEEFYS